MKSVEPFIFLPKTNVADNGMNIGRRKMNYYWKTLKLIRSGWKLLRRWLLLGQVHSKLVYSWLIEAEPHFLADDFISSSRWYSPNQPPQALILSFYFLPSRAFWNPSNFCNCFAFWRWYNGDSIHCLYITFSNLLSFYMAVLFFLYGLAISFNMDPTENRVL